MRLTPSGATKVAAVIGSPVHHSLSPALHNAAFAECGLDWVFVAFDVPAGRGAAAVRAMRDLDLAGLSVTMPHKDAAAAAVDVLSDDAAALGAVNCVVRQGGELVGHSTDGPGFLDSLVDADADPRGRRTVVLGAGGAARAVTRAVAGAGAAEVVVINRTPGRGDAAAALAGPVGRTGTVDDVAGADLVINATPVGMSGPTEASSLPVPASCLGRHQIVIDLVYQPLVTPFLQAAADRGAATVGGLGMLVHQAARAFRLWTGHEPPLDTMRAAVGFSPARSPSSGRA